MASDSADEALLLEELLSETDDWTDTAAAADELLDAVERLERLSEERCEGADEALLLDALLDETDDRTDEAAAAADELLDARIESNNVVSCSETFASHISNKYRILGFDRLV